MRLWPLKAKARWLVSMRALLWPGQKNDQRSPNRTTGARNHEIANGVGVGQFESCGSEFLDEPLGGFPPNDRGGPDAVPDGPRGEALKGGARKSKRDPSNQQHPVQKMQDVVGAFVAVVEVERVAKRVAEKRCNNQRVNEIWVLGTASPGSPDQRRHDQREKVERRSKGHTLSFELRKVREQHAERDREHQSDPNGPQHIALFRGRHERQAIGTMALTGGCAPRIGEAKFGVWQPGLAFGVRVVCPNGLGRGPRARHDNGFTKCCLLMGSNELVWKSAVEQVAALNGREVSAVEVLDCHVAQTDAHNERLNLVVTRDLERAYERARQIDDDRANGRAVGPIAGLAMTVKDSLMTAGVRTTSGAPELSTYVPDRDAATVARLRSAGAVIWGKTNLPIYANDVQSYNDVFGVSNNPWDVSRSVGGSSGGSAGAVAAGFSPLEVGSDIAGSIRNPAAMCGVVGHKPSYGIVSAKGQIPGPPGTLTQADLAVVGPFGRTSADCALALDLLAGPDDWHEGAWQLRLPMPRRSSISGLRVAVWANDPYCPVDPQIEQAIRNVATSLEGHGAIVDDSARPVGFDFAKADLTFWNLLGGALSGSWSLDEIEAMALQVAAGNDVAGELGVNGATLRHRSWLTNNERRLQMRARWREFFSSWDVVLAPVSPTAAIPHDHSSPQSQRTITVAGQTRSYLDQMRWMGLFGLAYLPVTCVPVGLMDGKLPIGMQIVGPYLEDRTTLAVAQLVEGITGGTKRPIGL